MLVSSPSSFNLRNDRSPFLLFMSSIASRSWSRLLRNNNPILPHRVLPQQYSSRFRLPPLHRSVSGMATITKMDRSNRIRQVFTEGQRPAFGAWQILPGTNISRLLAGSGMDWVVVDCEHGNIDGTSLGCMPFGYRTDPLIVFYRCCDAVS